MKDATLFNKIQDLRTAAALKIDQSRADLADPKEVAKSMQEIIDRVDAEIRISPIEQCFLAIQMLSDMTTGNELRAQYFLSKTKELQFYRIRLEEHLIKEMAIAGTKELRVGDNLATLTEKNGHKIISIR